MINSEDLCLFGVIDGLQRHIEDRAPGSLFIQFHGGMTVGLVDFEWYGPWDGDLTFFNASVHFETMLGCIQTLDRVLAVCKQLSPLPDDD